MLYGIGMMTNTNRQEAIARYNRVKAWERTASNRLRETINTVALLHGYDAAPWGWTREAVAQEGR